jgi:hypothetical protein
LRNNSFESVFFYLQPKDIIMKYNLINHRAITCFALLAALLGTTQVQAGLMSWADQSAEGTRIKAEYKSDKLACAHDRGNLRDICRAQAKGKKQVARAELDYARSGKSTDADKVIIAKADAAYAVAKEQCDDAAGNAKDVCRAEAKAAHTKSKAEIKRTEKIMDAQSTAATVSSHADLKVAVEKCDALSGASKIACVDAAKNQYKPK